MTDFPAGTIEAMALWLLRRVPQLRQHPAAADAVHAITAVVANAQRAIDRPPDLACLGPCDTCGLDIYAAPGDTMVTCYRCRSAYDVRDRREHLLARAENTLGTAAEISRALTGWMGREVTPSSINGYVFRGRLTRRGVNQSGYALYRVGDVVDLIACDHEKSRVSHK